MMLRHSMLLGCILGLWASTVHANVNIPSGKFGLWAEFLYITPIVEDTYFVLKNDGPVQGGPNGDHLANDFCYHPAFRVGVDYTFCDCNELRLTFTQLFAEDSRSVSGDVLWATVGRSDTGAFFNPFAGTSGSKIDLHYHRLDVLYGIPVFNWCTFQLSLQGGLEYANIHYKQDLFYQNDSNNQFSSITQKSKLWGVGPEFGFEGELLLGKCMECVSGAFSITFASSGSLLAGEANRDYVQQLESQSLTTFSSNDDPNWSLTPAWHANIGIAYEFVCSCTQVFLELGYEVHSYIRGISLEEVTAATNQDARTFADYSNLGLHGMYVSFGIAF